MKTCVVTGGSAGIGLAIVEEMLARGYKVFNLDLQAGRAGEYIPCDMASDVQVSRAISEVLERCGCIDTLVANAGIHVSANIEDTSEALLDKVLEVNVKGAYRVIKKVIPGMRNQASGAIVIMSSDQALVAKHNSFAYNLSKAALASMAKTTALDYAQFNIRVNAVCPGTIETPLYHNAISHYCERSGTDEHQVHQAEAAMQPLGRLGQPQEVAKLVAFLLSDEAAFITGSLQVIDGGYTCS